MSSGECVTESGKRGGEAQTLEALSVRVSESGIGKILLLPCF